MKKIIILLMVFHVACHMYSQQSGNHLNMNMGNLYPPSNAKIRSIIPENFTGDKGKGGMAVPYPNASLNSANDSCAAGDFGQGWKVNPFIRIKYGETYTLVEIEGSMAIQYIGMKPNGNWRFSIIRVYWDNETKPSVECPVDDFFALGWKEYATDKNVSIDFIKIHK